MPEPCATVINWRGQKRYFLERAAEVPVLPAIQLFWGENDRIMPIRQGEELATALENCSLQRFVGAGHVLHWERSHELSQSLLAYLAAPHIPRAALRRPQAHPELSLAHQR